MNRAASTALLAEHPAWASLEYTLNLATSKRSQAFDVIEPQLLASSLVYLWNYVEVCFQLARGIKLFSWWFATTGFDSLIDFWNSRIRLKHLKCFCRSMCSFEVHTQSMRIYHVILVISWFWGMISFVNKSFVS